MAGGNRVKARRWTDLFVKLDTTRGYGLKAELDATEANNAKSLSAAEADWRQVCKR